LRNVELTIGDGARGWGDASYDVIVLTGSTPILPDVFVKQLNSGGRLFAVVGEVPAMSARLMHKPLADAVTSITLFETVIDPLQNAVQPARFLF
jgi:protein-L-isoaspartate(D-aspartate) O-methyltransferase